MNNGIGISGLPVQRDPISIWRVYLPVDVDRDQYVKTCFLTGTVSLINSNAEVQHKVKVGRLVLQMLTFPIDNKSFGSEVLCVSLPYSGSLYIVDVYTSSSEFYDQKENQYRLIQATSNGFAEVRIDGNEGKIFLTVDGEQDTEILINVVNKDKTGKVTVNANGQIKIIAPKIYLNESEEPMLLGNKTVQMISDILTQLGQESAGPYPLLGQSTYQQLKESLEQLKSTISFVK